MAGGHPLYRWWLGSAGQGGGGGGGAVTIFRRRVLIPRHSVAMHKRRFRMLWWVLPLVDVLIRRA